MKFSIITPTFNSAKTISKNIESLLAQKYENFEHIIIDNLSTDHTLEITRSIYRAAGLESKLKIISEKDKGISDAFNKGIRNASGEIIGILNSDDYFYSDQTLNIVFKAFQENPQSSFIHGDLFFEDDFFGSNLRKPLLCPVEYAMPFNHPTMFVRKTTYEEIGHFQENIRYCMDLDFVCRLISSNKEGKYVSSPFTVMCSGGTSDRNELKVLKEYAEILRNHNKWNSSAKRYHWEKYLRIRAKQMLKAFHLQGLVKYWRNYKWNQQQSSEGK